MNSLLNICYSPEKHQFLDIHLPENNIFPVLVYFHGGGLESGDKSEDKIFYDYMNKQGIAIVTANYRMYPHAKYPDFLTDAAEAVAWVFKNINSYGKSSGIFIGGSSAGGYISQMLCFDESWLGKHNIKPDDISGFIHDAGQPTCHFNILRERGLDTRRVIIDDSSSLYHIMNNKKYPPMHIIVSDNDMENRYEQTMLLISTLKHFGYDKNIELKIMHGNHCEYINKTNEKGENIFGQIVSEFILKEKI